MQAASQKVVSELFDQAVETFNGALKTGLKVQEEATRWWLDVLGDAGSLQKVQHKLQEIVEDALPAAQKNAEECLKVLDRGSRTSMELLKKAFETGQSQSASEIQAKVRDLWEASLTALRSNAQAVVQLNARALEACSDLVGKTFAGNGKATAERST
jgi:hypothetical protein